MPGGHHHVVVVVDGSGGDSWGGAVVVTAKAGCHPSIVVVGDFISESEADIPVSSICQPVKYSSKKYAVSRNIQVKIIQPPRIFQKRRKTAECT
jgi:hypothetical protein